MQNCPRHCPFLNREDCRCAERLKVGALRHAYRHCFAEYKACPTYLELLVERRVRRCELTVLPYAASVARIATYAQAQPPAAAEIAAA